VSGASMAQDSNEFSRRRRSRNLAVALGIGALCALFFLITIVRMSAGH